MKDEIQELIPERSSYGDVVTAAEDWMDYYNRERYRWEIEKLAPEEYYRYIQTGFYPLKPRKSKRAHSRSYAPAPEV